MSDVPVDTQTGMQESSNGSEVIPNCLAVVEEYQHREISRPRAVFILSNEMFDASSHLSADTVDAALETYLEMLQEVNSDYNQVEQQQHTCNGQTQENCPVLQ
ncbi:hypothetical protein A0H81_05427 [Grifola frondosa]|uniref:Uncharacterized protein n=1 Tax=Grifola frondosa TaxID=5627 RepID=A0A1C7MDL2_GRIFR|nr:hypothetical protein A0H81_05427 [Grifola frondosa]